MAGLNDMRAESIIREGRVEFAQEQVHAAAWMLAQVTVAESDLDEGCPSWLRRNVHAYYVQCCDTYERSLEVARGRADNN